MATTIKALPKSYRPVANAISQGFITQVSGPAGYLYVHMHRNEHNGYTAIVRKMVNAGFVRKSERSDRMEMTGAGTAAMLLENIGPLSSSMAQMLHELATNPFTREYVKPGRVGYAKRRALVALKNRNLIFWNGAYWALNGAGDTAFRAITQVPWSWQ